MIHIKVLTASILTASLGLTACGGDDNNNSSNPSNPSNPDTPADTQQSQLLKGKITDVNNKELTNVEVKVGDISVVTDSSGNYSLPLADDMTQVVVLVKKSGYLTTARELIIQPNQSYNLDISISADQVTTAFDSRAGVNDLEVSGAKVTIPADSVVNSDGSDFAGTVTIATNYYNPDSVAGMQAFAQPFAGQDADGSDQTDLVTVGVIDVKLTDPATGAELDLKDGASATLLFPEASTDQNLATIPLWYYDEDQLIWIKDGVATRQADGSYRGQVSHFTLWNVDIPVGQYFATLEGCVIDKITGEVPNYLVEAQIIGRGYSNMGTVDQEGKFSIQVPFNTPLTLSPVSYVVAFDNITIPALAQNATYQINDSQCIEISAANSNDDITLDDNTIDELPLDPVPVTPTPSIPDVPFKPPVTDNTTGLIGYDFNFDIDDDDKLENVEFYTMSTSTDNIIGTFESLYTEINYQDYEEFFTAYIPQILTRQGLSQESTLSVVDNKLEYKLLGSSVRGNQLIQSLDNGYRTISTYNDKSISGLKIGDVLSYNIDEDEFPKSVINNLNDLSFSKGIFTGAAGCKVLTSIYYDVDYFTFNGPGYNGDFDNEVKYLDLNPTRGTWAGIPWALKEEADEKGYFPALLNYDDSIHKAFYTRNGFVNLSTEETTECAYYNEAAKEQIFDALSTAYPDL